MHCIRLVSSSPLPSDYSLLFLLITLQCLCTTYKVVVVLLVVIVVVVCIYCVKMSKQCIFRKVFSPVSVQWAGSGLQLPIVFSFRFRFHKKKHLQPTKLVFGPRINKIIINKTNIAYFTFAGFINILLILFDKAVTFTIGN